ncbi:MAG: aminoacyl-tRNA deacylase [Bacteroidota bacterium]
MPVKKLLKYLDNHDIKYLVIKHSPAYTAQEIAQAAHIPGKNFAKTVIIKIDGILAMAVLPARNMVDIDVLRDITGAEYTELAGEKEFEDIFPGCETGAMPPFGNLYGLKVYVAELLSKDKEIVFNAGSHTELIKMDYSDFEKLVRPVVVKFELT